MMGDSHTFWVKAKIDDVNRINAGVLADADRAAAWSGLVIGINAGELPEVTSKSLRAAYEAASSWRAEADAFREKQRAGGKVSADRRTAKYGTSQPSKPNPEVEPEVTSSPTSEVSLEVEPEPATSYESPFTRQGNDERPSPPFPPPGEAGQADPGREGKKGVPAVPASVVAIWNAKIEGTPLPKASLTPGRERVISGRLREPGWFDAFTAACGFLAGSSWHHGQNDRQWVASIDYVLKEGKAIELAERGAAPPPARRGSRSHRATADEAYRTQLLADERARSERDAGEVSGEVAL